MKIGLIYGGVSVEHEISVITALQVYEVIKDSHEVINIYFAKNGKFYIGEKLNNIENYKDLDLLKNSLTEVYFINENGVYLKENKRFGKKHQIDLGFLALHGASGEDGKIQGFLDTIGLTYTGCNHLGSSIGQDKVVSKDILKANGISILPYVHAYDTDDFEEIVKKVDFLGYPVIIKPATLGSSVGINICNSKDDLNKLLQESFQYDFKVIIEHCISGFRELNCSILGSYQSAIPSSIEEVVAAENFLSFKDKYLSGAKGKSKGMSSTPRIVPASIEESTKVSIQNECIRAFRALNLSGAVRFDLMLHEGNVYINEVNTIPGSLAYYLWEDAGLNRKQLYLKLIELAVLKKRVTSSKITSYDSNVLSNAKGNFGGKKGKL